MIALAGVVVLAAAVSPDSAEPAVEAACAPEGCAVVVPSEPDEASGAADALRASAAVASSGCCCPQAVRARAAASSRPAKAVLRGHPSVGDGGGRRLSAR